jgi:hypothetical protein
MLAKNVKIWEIYNTFLKYLHFYIMDPYRLGQFFLVNLVFSCTKKNVPGHDMFLGKKYKYFRNCAIFFREFCPNLKSATNECMKHKMVFLMNIMLVYIPK